MHPVGYYMLDKYVSFAAYGGTVGMGVMRRCTAILALAAVALFLVGESARAQATGDLVIPVRVVDGHLMVVGFIANRAGDVNDLSLEVSFEDSGVLTLHGDQHGWLDSPAIVKVTLKPDVPLTIPGNEVRADSRQDRQQWQNAMTRLHSNQLDEHKVKGTLGAGFLRKYRVVLDVAAGTLTLSPPEVAAPLQAEVVRDFELRLGRLWLSMDYADSRSGDLLLGGDAYDTFIDSAVARKLGKPAGNVGPVWLGLLAQSGGAQGIDLAQQMAFRPRDMGQDADKGNDAAVFITGVNFLQGFRVEVDWTDSKIGFTRTTRPEYPQADFAFFQAQLDGGAATMQAYLEQYPDARLSPDAARSLMAARLEQPDASDDELIAAMQWVADTSPPERRMENCVEYVKRIRLMPGREQAVVLGGKLALQYSREAITVQDTYRLHNIIGEAYMAQDQVTEAWKHFLSAAFMPLDDRTDLPHNIAVNVNLARAYDRMGRNTRAYSRYLRAQEMLIPIKDQVEGIDDATVNDMPAAQRAEVQMLKQALIDIKEAVGRLQQQIPAEELELLEG